MNYFVLQRRPELYKSLFAFARIPSSLSERSVDPAVGAAGMISLRQRLLLDRDGEATAP